MDFYFRMFWRCARLISDECIHVCKHESKTYKHTKIICFCRPDVYFQWKWLWRVLHNIYSLSSVSFRFTGKHLFPKNFSSKQMEMGAQEIWFKWNLKRSSKQGYQVTKRKKLLLQKCRRISKYLLEDIRVGVFPSKV